MRYAHGIMIGTTLTGVIFVVAAILNIAGLGADAAELEILWSIYVLWFISSVALAILLPLIIYFIRSEIFREFLIYEAGGFGLFSPLWLLILTDIAGDPWYSILNEGIDDGLIGFGPTGRIEGIYIGPLFLVPFFIMSIIFGLVFLRPSFIKKYGIKASISDAKPVKESPGTTESSGEESMEVDMPDVTAPTPTVDSVTSLREILIELDIQEPTINLILNSGIGTITDLVATSAENLAFIARLDKRVAENILIAVQKKLWFSDI